MKRLFLIICVFLLSYCSSENKRNTGKNSLQRDSCCEIISMVVDTSKSLTYLKDYASIGEEELKSSLDVKSLLATKGVDTLNYSLDFILNTQNTKSLCVGFNKIRYVIKDTNYFEASTPSLCHNCYLFRYDKNFMKYQLYDSISVIENVQLIGTFKFLLKRDFINIDQEDLRYKYFEFLYSKEPDSELIVSLHNKLL